MVRFRRLLANPYRVLAGVLGAVAVAFAIASGCGSKSPPQSLPSIHFSYPSGWGQLPRSRWPAVGAPRNAAVVIERHGNSAHLVVLRGPKTTASGRTAKRINARLKKAYVDYEFISTRRITLPDGAGPPIRAMLFSYARAKHGVFHTITLIPAGRVSFVVYTASPPRSTAIAREISRILKSARLTYPKG